MQPPPAPGVGSAGPMLGRLFGWLCVAEAAVTVAMLFAPWTRSGAARRSSFETLRTADKLGLLDEGALGFLAVVWVFLPAILAMALLAMVTGRTPLAVALSVAVATVCGLVGALVWFSDEVRAEWGAAAAAGAAVVTVMGAAAWSAWTRRRVITP